MSTDTSSATVTTMSPPGIHFDQVDSSSQWKRNQQLLSPPRTSCRRRRSAWAGPSIFVVSLIFSCSPGKIYLTSEQNRKSDDPGDVSTAMDSMDATGNSSGGNEWTDPTFLSSGGSAPFVFAPEGGRPGDDRQPNPRELYSPNGYRWESLPCIFSHECPPPCSVSEDGCLRCETAEQCSDPVSYCEDDGGGCVECLINEDCRQRFGPGFSNCEGGWCTSCEEDSDCREGEFCAGSWCSECWRNYDCDNGQICVDARCVNAFGD